LNRINKVVIMGGSYQFKGNSSACAEFNFFADPVAAKIITDNFKNILIYPWEPCELHKLAYSVFENTANDKEYNEDRHTHSFCTQMLKKKMNSSEEGIFADYGAALAAFYPSIIKSSFNGYGDVLIDGTDDTNGAMILSCKNIEKRNKFKIVRELDQNLYIEFFNFMIGR
jgi:inosine-uridine nucleoside N-ribohydrolase